MNNNKTSLVGMGDNGGQECVTPKCYNKRVLGGFVATLELQGTDKVKQDLKDIEESLDRIIEKQKLIQSLPCVDTRKCGENL